MENVDLKEVVGSQDRLTVEHGVHHHDESHQEDGSQTAPQQPDHLALSEKGKCKLHHKRSPGHGEGRPHHDGDGHHPEEGRAGVEIESEREEGRLRGVDEGSATGVEEEPVGLGEEKEPGGDLGAVPDLDQAVETPVSTGRDQPGQQSRAQHDQHLQSGNIAVGQFKLFTFLKTL